MQKLLYHIVYRYSIYCIVLGYGNLDTTQKSINQTCMIQIRINSCWDQKQFRTRNPAVPRRKVTGTPKSAPIYLVTPRPGRNAAAARTGL